MTSTPTLLPTPSKRTIFPEEVTVVHYPLPNGSPLFSWVQGPRFILGNTGSELVLLETDTGKPDAGRTSRVVAYVPLPEGLLSRVKAEFLFADASRIDGTDIRKGWLDLCRLASETFPESAGDICRFIASEEARLERADNYLARADTSIADDFDVEQHVEINPALSVSRRLFSLSSIDNLNTAPVSDGIGYIGDFYTLSHPGAEAVSIYKMKRSWFLRAPWRDREASFSTFAEVFSTYAKEAPTLGIPDLSGHEKIEYLRLFEQALIAIDAAGGLPDLFLPRL